MHRNKHTFTCPSQPFPVTNLSIHFRINLEFASNEFPPKNKQSPKWAPTWEPLQEGITMSHKSDGYPAH